MVPENLQWMWNSRCKWNECGRDFLRPLPCPIGPRLYVTPILGTTILSIKKIEKKIANGLTIQRPSEGRTHSTSVRITVYYQLRIT